MSIINMAGLLEALKKQNFGKEDSLIASALMHPQEGLLKSKAWLEQQMNTAMGMPLPQDESSMYQYAPVDLARQQAALNLAGLAETGSLPFAPTSKGGLLGTVSRMTDNALPETEFSKAHKLAQRNASLPVDQGGLGLLPDNTAMDRAKAMGFVYNQYHGTTADITEVNPALADASRTTGTPQGAMVVTSSPQTAATYGMAYDGDFTTSYHDGANILPLMINKGKNISMNAKQGGYIPNWNDLYHPKYPDVNTTDDFAYYAKAKKKDSATIKNVIDNAKTSKAIGDTTFLFDPALVRSKFAAFDPLKRNSPNILASGLLASFLMDQKNARNTD